MVRLKQRYLLLDILYPDPSTWPPSTQQNQPAAHRIHAPTADTLTPALLAKLIRDQVSELFGDWGVGRLGGVNAGGVSGLSLFPSLSLPLLLVGFSHGTPKASYKLTKNNSEIFVPGYVYGYYPVPTCVVQARVDGVVVYHTRARVCGRVGAWET